MRVYLSSTFHDLKDLRQNLARDLRKAKYDVMLMEEYVAQDNLVEFVCTGDVVKCDVYLGVFAWRYGHIPEDNNPEQLSITEIEYQAAGVKGMPRLTFLLEDDVPWETKDADLTRINKLRESLKKRSSGYFSNSDKLGVEVLAALRVHESTVLTQQLEAIDVVHKSQELGPSYMMNITNKLRLLANVQFIELRLAPTPWWNTRLYLVAALAQEFAKVKGLVFLDGEGHFILMTDPKEICYRLTREWPKLKEAFEKFRNKVETIEKVEIELWRYPLSIMEVFNADEQTTKHVLSLRDMEYELGIARQAEIVDVTGKEPRSIQREVLERRTPFAALVHNNELKGLVDREKLAMLVAKQALR